MNFSIHPNKKYFPIFALCIRISYFQIMILKFTREMAGKIRFDCTFNLGYSCGI